MKFNPIKPISLFVLIHLSLLAMTQQKLALEQCRQMALEHNETIKMAKKTIEKAKAEKAIARSYFLPSLSANGTMVYLNETVSKEMYLPTYVPNATTGILEPNLFIHPTTGTSVTGADGNPIFNMYAYLPLELSLKGAYLAGINLEQPLFTGGKIIAGNNMAKIGESMAQDNWELAQINAVAEADQSYWMYVMIGEKVKLANEMVQLLASLVNRVENSFEAGMVHKNELLKVQVKYNQAQLDLQQAKSGWNLARMSLCRITGLPFTTQIIATDTVIDFSADLLNSIETGELTLRPEYKLLSKQIDFEDEIIKLTRADYLPTFGVSAGYSRIGGVEITGSDLSSNNLNVMGSLKIPIFHWGEGKQKIASAKINRELKQLALQKNSGLMQLEIEQAKMNLQDAYLRVQMSDKAQEYANENLRVSQNNYELGAELMTDLLMAQTHWQQAQANAIESKTDYKLKETMYLKAIGKLATKNK